MTEEIKQAKIITGIVHILRLQLLNVIVDQSTVAYAVAYFLNKIMNLLKNKKGSLTPRAQRIFPFHTSLLLC